MPCLLAQVTITRRPGGGSGGEVTEDLDFIIKASDLGNTMMRHFHKVMQPFANETAWYMVRRNCINSIHLFRFAQCSTNLTLYTWSMSLKFFITQGNNDNHIVFRIYLLHNCATLWKLCVWRKVFSHWSYAQPFWKCLMLSAMNCIIINLFMHFIDITVLCSLNCTGKIGIIYTFSFSSSFNI